MNCFQVLKEYVKVSYSQQSLQQRNDLTLRLFIKLFLKRVNEGWNLGSGHWNKVRA